MFYFRYRWNRYVYSLLGIGFIFLLKKNQNLWIHNVIKNHFLCDKKNENMEFKKKVQKKNLLKIALCTKKLRDLNRSYYEIQPYLSWSW